MLNLVLNIHTRPSRWLLVVVTLLGLAVIPQASIAIVATSTSPVNYATNVSPNNPTFILNFAAAACSFPTLGTGAATIRKQSDNTAVASMLEVTWTNPGTSSITITSNVNLDTYTEYRLEVSALQTCPMGMDPHTITIIFTTGACSYSFCDASIQAVIDHLSPPDNAHFMQSYEGLAIVFEDVVTQGSGIGDLTIRKYSDDSIIETISLAGGRVTGWGTRTLTIDPVGNLANDTHYYINMPYDDGTKSYETSADKDSWDFWTKATPNTFSGTGL